MVIPTRPGIFKDKEKFLELLGDGTEFVNVTFVGRKDLSGQYLYERSNGTNVFVRQKKDVTRAIDILDCETEHLRFDIVLGAIPLAPHYNHRILGPKQKKEYETRKQKLEERGRWHE